MIIFNLNYEMDSFHLNYFPKKLAKFTFPDNIQDIQESN
jgi:hypothetical protein